MRLIDANAIKIKPVYMHDICGVVMIRVEDIARILNDMPTISPASERKTGKWIPINDMYNRISGKCSVCGWEAHLYEDDVVGMDFCPNCGARLEVKE